MNFSDPPRPLNLTQLPRDSQLALARTGFCEMEPDHVTRLMGLNTLTRALSVPPRQNRFWLHHNNGVSFLLWPAAQTMELTELMIRASWYDIMGFIRGQVKHLLCWAFVASDMVSAMRILRRWEDHYSPLSVWDLCRNCAPYYLGADSRAKPPHVCYGFNTAGALQYIRASGIHREHPTEHDSFMCREPFPGVHTPPIGVEIRDVICFRGLEEALAQIHVYPIAADCIVFPELFLPGNQIYRGPTSRNSRFGGYHAVSIMAFRKYNGELIASCKLSNGMEVGSGGYVNVSLSIMIMCVGADDDHQLTVRGTPWPMHLLTNFVALDMHENERQEKRDEKEDKRKEKRDEKEDEHMNTISRIHKFYLGFNCILHAYVCSLCCSDFGNIKARSTSGIQIPKLNQVQNLDSSSKVMCANFLRDEATKFEELRKKFIKDKADRLQGLKGNKEQTMISEHERFCPEKFAQSEEPVKKKKRDDKTFSTMRKTLGSFLDNEASDGGIAT